MPTRKEKILGRLKYGELPDSVKLHVDFLLAARKLRTKGTKMGGTAIVLSIPLAYINNQHFHLPLNALAIPILAAAATAGSFRSFTPTVKQRTLNVAEIISQASLNQESITRFFREGATHIMVDKIGDIHFVQATKLRGKLFRPLFSRFRTPAEQRHPIFISRKTEGPPS